MSNKKRKSKLENQQQQSDHLGQQELQNQNSHHAQNQPSSNSRSDNTRSNQQFDADNPSIVQSEN